MSLNRRLNIELAAFIERRRREENEIDPQSSSSDVVKVAPGAAHRPSYYSPKRHNARIPFDADVCDVIDAFGIDDWFLASALKYIIRAGRKPGNSREKDLTKAMECVQRRLLLDAPADLALGKPDLGARRIAVHPALTPLSGPL